MHLVPSKCPYRVYSRRHPPACPPPPTTTTSSTTTSTTTSAQGPAAQFAARTLGYEPQEVDGKVAKQAVNTLPIVVSFLRSCGEQLLGILPRKVRLVRARVSSDPAVVWPVVPLLVPPPVATELVQACDRYFDAVCQHQVCAPAPMPAMQWLDRE